MGNTYEEVIDEAVTHFVHLKKQILASRLRAAAIVGIEAEYENVFGELPQELSTANAAFVEDYGKRLAVKARTALNTRMLTSAIEYLTNNVGLEVEMLKEDEED